MPAFGLSQLSLVFDARIAGATGSAGAGCASAGVGDGSRSAAGVSGALELAAGAEAGAGSTVSCCGGTDKIGSGNKDFAGTASTGVDFAGLSIACADEEAEVLDFGEGTSLADALAGAGEILFVEAGTGPGCDRAGAETTGSGCADFVGTGAMFCFAAGA